MVEAALNYNEAKVKQGKAVCLQAVNYLQKPHEMNFYQKLESFRRLNELNERATTKTIHISLNFDPSEKLSDVRLTELANAYMEKIGFGEQPFLVYKHEDAGHPHIHIVSNTIRHNGSRINTHNLGRNQSEKARKELEQLFGLVKAERHKQNTNPISSVKIEKALYGKQETKRAIANVVNAVFNGYRFASLPEYNAALRQFNVIADRGKEDGRIYKNGGLNYRILDGKGSSIGVPIKASSIYCQPTLKNLETKFLLNQSAKEPYKQRLKGAIEAGLMNAPSMKAFVTNLEAQNIYTVLRQTSGGVVYGLTYVDNESKCVFNGSDLGKGYSAAAIQARLGGQTGENKVDKEDEKRGGSLDAFKERTKTQEHLPKKGHLQPQAASLLDGLLSTKEQQDNVPANLLNKKRKKKKRKDNNL
jgi:hypothetical protein